MSSLLFKLSFRAPVHFGSGENALSLYSSEEHFRADTLFSALCHTAISMGGEALLSKVISLAHSGRLRLTDSMPWKDEDFYLPKPCITSERSQELPAAQRKAVKKLRWLPVSDFGAFADSVRGGAPYAPRCREEFGVHKVYTRAAISDGKDAAPYDVGAFIFHENCGLWFICLCPDDCDEMMEGLVSALGHSGIGAKVSSGFGSFAVDDLIYLDEPFDEQTEWLSKALGAEGSHSLLLTSSLPSDCELDAALSSASYQLIRRGGFVLSESYAEQAYKKQTQYFLSAGSVLQTRFKGELYDVGNGGRHPVYRYSRPVFLGVSL